MGLCRSFEFTILRRLIAEKGGMLSVLRRHANIKDGNLDEVYVCNFQRDGSRPTVFDMQVLITNHFVLLKGKLIGSERQMEAF